MKAGSLYRSSFNREDLSQRNAQAWLQLGTQCLKELVILAVIQIKAQLSSCPPHKPYLQTLRGTQQGRGMRAAES